MAKTEGFEGQMANFSECVLVQRLNTQSASKANDHMTLASSTH